MSVPAKPRRAALLCCHFTRNLAYYRAGWDQNKVIFPQNDFWITTNCNFLDIAVLEWCKLFADQKAFHNYKKVVVDPRNFLPQMYSNFGFADIEWAKYLQAMKTYRDKFIAHLDRDKTMHIPQMDMAQFSINYIYQTMQCEQITNVFNGLPDNLNEYSQQSHAEAVKFYAKSA